MKTTAALAAVLAALLFAGCSSTPAHAPMSRAPMPTFTGTRTAPAPAPPPQSVAPVPTFTAESVMAYLDTANGERTFQDACNASGAPDPSLWQCWFDKIEPYNKKWLKVYLTTDGSYSRSEQKALAKQAGAWFRNFLADYSPKITTFVVYVNGVDSGTAYAG